MRTRYILVINMSAFLPNAIADDICPVESRRKRDDRTIGGD